jgi:hypothetical protein
MLQVFGVDKYACGQPPLKNKLDGKSRLAGCHDRALIESQNPISAMTSNYPFYIGR